MLKDGEPVLAIGTPGSDGICQRMGQVMVNIVDFEIEDRIAPATIEALRAKGSTLTVIPSDEGSVNGVMRDPKTGFLGGADPRRYGNEGAWWGPTSQVYAIGW